MWLCGHGAQPSDELTALIAQVERELEAALRSLEAEPLQTRLPKPSQLDELQSAWHQQAERIRELDTLLAQPTLAAAPAAAGGSTAERVSQSGQSRQQNLRQLQALRQQMHDDLLATLDSVRELITRIHLTKFTGASATRTAELIAQIATTVVAKTSSNI